MLGGAIYRQLRNAGEPVEGWSRATKIAPDGAKFHTRPLDLGAYGPVRLVIHCAAMTDADACEENPSGARRVNAEWPGRLAAQAARIGARFIYVSTDAVYDGETPGRLSREDDPPHPLSTYARTKLAGEAAVLQAYPDATVVRTTMFGWTLPHKREKLAEQIVRGLVERKPLRLWGDAIFSPLHVSDLAVLLVDLAAIRYPGIVNVGSPLSLSKAEFGRLIADTTGLDGSLIEETSVDDAGLAAARTKDTALDVSVAETLLGPLPSAGSGIQLLAREFTDGTVERLKGGPWP
jgi:dTDP-4-dehydrorhamnose reductase